MIGNNIMDNVINNLIDRKEKLQKTMNDHNAKRLFTLELYQRTLDLKTMDPKEEKKIIKTMKKINNKRLKSLKIHQDLFDDIDNLIKEPRFL